MSTRHPTGNHPTPSGPQDQDQVPDPWDAYEEPTRELVSQTPRQGLQAFRLDGAETPPPHVGDQGDYADAEHSLTKTAKAFHLAGLGAHGRIVGVVSEIDISLLYPNPNHPRDDWKVKDKAMDDLIRAIMNGGQKSPIQVTAMLPDDPLTAQGYAYYIVDGHRVYYAMQMLNLSKILIEPARNEDGSPLDAIDMLGFYLGRKLNEKPLTAPQVVRGFLTILDLSQADTSLEESLSIRTIMELFGVSQATAEHAHYLLQNDTDDYALSRTVADNQVGMKAAIALLKKLKEYEESHRPLLLHQVVEAVQRTNEDGQLRPEDVLALLPQRQYAAPIAPTTTMSTAPKGASPMTSSGNAIYVTLPSGYQLPLYSPGLATADQNPTAILAALLHDATVLYRQLHDDKQQLPNVLETLGKYLNAHVEELDVLADAVYA